MIDVDETRLVLDQIAYAKDPLGLVRELVLASGGTWIDAATVDMAFLFEVNLHGVRGFGLGASAAIDNWIANAEAVVASDAVTNFNKAQA
ncbi:hypothetical protein N9C56_07135 [Paracoccaceae bacterium]|jgi:hypothetical protein|nr:hypothetical protein [Paracoccaceae bacterium]